MQQSKETEKPKTDNDKSYFGLKQWDHFFYPVVKRKKSEPRIEECPFCGEQHLHGSGEGHRYAHCSDAHGFFNEIIIKGHIVSQYRGYFIEEY